MQAHRVERLVLVSSAEAGLRWRFSPRAGLNRVMHAATISAWRRSTLVDLRRMEALVQGCDRLWTIVRGGRSVDLDHRTPYVVVDDGRPGWFTARFDLAAECVTQLESNRTVHGTITVTTGESTTAVLQALYNASRARSARRSTPTHMPAPSRNNRTAGSSELIRRLQLLPDTHRRLRNVRTRSCPTANYWLLDPFGCPVEVYIQARSAN